MVYSAAHVRNHNDYPNDEHFPARALSLIVPSNPN